MPVRRSPPFPFRSSVTFILVGIAMCNFRWNVLFAVTGLRVHGPIVLVGSILGYRIARIHPIGIDIHSRRQI